jgi:hypothetical protein
MSSAVEHIEMLRRRAGHLAAIVADWKGKKGGEVWARRELAAIEWALDIVDPERRES